jgi:hypothetical protein
MATLRELFHSLGNKHNLITIGCGATEEIVKECLEKEGANSIEGELLEIKKNLQQLVESAQEADKIAIEIHERVYKAVDPDQPS